MTAQLPRSASIEGGRASITLRSRMPLGWRFAQQLGTVALVSGAGIALMLVHAPVGLLAPALFVGGFPAAGFVQLFGGTERVTLSIDPGGLALRGWREGDRHVPLDWLADCEVETTSHRVGRSVRRFRLLRLVGVDGVRLDVGEVSIDDAAGLDWFVDRVRAAVLARDGR